jgi:pantetheine-phosphate adenylyltransferase
MLLLQQALLCTKYFVSAAKKWYNILMSEKIAVYPGTFDPMTKGHFDLIKRSSQLYDRLIVAVAAVSNKEGALFSDAERMDMIQEELENSQISNVEVKKLDTLLVDFCRRENARVVVRGVRVYSDFEYESHMALTNRRLAPEIETLFMMPSENLAYVTASTVREVARYGGDISSFVTEGVAKRLETFVKKV